MNVIRLQCPYCKDYVDVEQKFFNKTDRVCCMSCNKAFDIKAHKAQYSNMLTEEDVETLSNESFNIASDDDDF